MVSIFRTLRRTWRARLAPAVANRAKVLAALTGALIAFGSPALAQESEASDARAFLVTPLSFVKQTDLDFGVIIPGDTNGVLFMDSTGAIATSGGVTHQDGTQQPARFWGYGQFNQRVLINVDANVYTLTRVGGTETMLWDQVTIGSRPPILITTNPRRFRIANPDGFFAFTIAGRLRVNANQAPGVYEGEFNVTLEYE
ncbi:MAG: DUF4402 domain-containing protein [Pseudomonadota bacterium]